jgi:hypothetical protein
MPTFRVTAPDGKTYDVTGPDGSTAEQALEQVRMQVAGGGGPSPTTPKSPPDAGAMATGYKRASQQRDANLVGGLLRGAGSIGATLLAPFDMAVDAAAGKGLSLESNRERRAAMDAGLQSLGADPNSMGYRGTKLATEIAGTAGTGGLLARGAAMIPGVAPNALASIGSAGMNAGTASGFTGTALRAAGGALTGGVSAGLVDPSQAVTGAVVGGALPGVMQAAGSAGNALGRMMRGPEQAPELANAVRAARESGYVIPPSQANPTLGNRLLEGMSGKITTAQNASARNQVITNAKAAEALGLPPETTLTPDVLDTVRQEAGKAYAAVSRLGEFDATAAKLPSSVRTAEIAENTLMGRPRSVTVDSGEVVRAWRQANADATAYYRQYARDANPETLTKAKAAAGEAKQIDEFLVKQIEASKNTAPAKLIEDLAAGRLDQQSFLQRALELTQRGDLAKELKEARTLIAKTHSVEGAMNAATGTVDARKLAQQLQKGKPLSGGLRESAEFAGRFPKAAQTVEQMGSLPQTSPLDWAAAGGLSMATANPLMLATAMARPAARAAVLSPAIQNRLVQQPMQQPNALAQLLGDPARELAYRSAPVALSGR